MPIKKCQTDGKKGFKYGDSGHCYPGNEGKAKAQKQAVAILISQKRIKAK